MHSILLIQRILLSVHFPERDSWIFDAVIIIIAVFLLNLLIRRRIRSSADMQKLLRDRVREKTQELEAEKERAEHSEKAKEQFLANMSHEIRTPMNAILQATRLLIEKEPRQEQMKYLNAIRQSSDNLLIIINDILDLSKIEAGRISLEKIDFDLHSQVMSAVNTLKFNADEKKLLLTCDIAPDVPKIVSGDPYRLTQIILNLAGNAIKFTEQGFVKVAVTALNKAHDSSEIHFEISDSGIGIAADKLAYIFDMFTQESSSTTRKFGGTGLGLAICKRLIELQGGSIDVKSRLGDGSQFIFKIVYEVPEHTFENEHPLSGTNINQTNLNGLRILLAEDNDFNQMVAVDSLESAIPGAKIDLAKNGKQAVEFVLKNTYDIILMDIQMPEMDGHEATRIIRKLSDEKINSIPIIAMTASVIKAEVDKCFESGMNAFVPKPFNIDELLTKIASVIKSGN